MSSSEPATICSLPIKIKCRRYKESLAHTGKLKHSMDFAVPESTRVYSALSGVVVFVKQNSRVGGPHRRYWYDGNRIVIRHRNGRYTAYEHLRYGGSRVKVGQRVRRGQFIGFSGNTGYSDGPHLHFELFHKPAEDECEGTTLRIRFNPIVR